MFPLAVEVSAACLDAIATRRTGAGWQELHKQVELFIESDEVSKYTGLAPNETSMVTRSIIRLNQNL